MIEGFSKLNKEDKIKLIINHSGLSEDDAGLLRTFLPQEKTNQKLIFDLSENVISSYALPFSVAPNFIINSKEYIIPMVIEESSVVAAASKSAKFWYKNGGFHSKIISTEKVGHVHFFWKNNENILFELWPAIAGELMSGTHSVTRKMKERGGGIISISLIDCTKKLANYFQLEAIFETVDAMGANFINTTLEYIAQRFKELIAKHENENITEHLEIIMSILSNYTPSCLVETSVEAPHKVFDKLDGFTSADDFLKRFETAVKIAEVDVSRAVTHNKGILNGIDAVVLATGNDFRATEAGAHAFASRNGRYTSLSSVEITSTKFKYKITIPLALGVIGGATSAHPLSRLALKILGQPNARELMKIVSAAGLANNFSAVKTLIGEGIQKGHMKMHLSNILNQLGADEKEKKIIAKQLSGKTISHQLVQKQLNELRQGN